MNDEPRRLVEGSEFSEALRTVVNEELSVERLRENEKKLKRRITALAVAGLSMVGTAKAVAKGATLVVAAGVLTTGGVVLYNHSTAPVEQTTPQKISPEPLAETPPTEPSFEETAPLSVPKKRRKTKALLQQKQKNDEPPTRSALPEQLQLYEEAERAARAGELARAVELLDQLERRYPQTALRPEIELSRVEYLSRAGRRERAVTEIEHLLAAPRHASRRTELLRMLADLWMRAGACDKASAVYRQLLTTELNEPAKRSIAAALAECQGKGGQGKE